MEEKQRSVNILRSSMVITKLIALIKDRIQQKELLERFNNKKINKDVLPGYDLFDVKRFRHLLTDSSVHSE